MSLASYVWDAANPNIPEAQLTGTSQLVAARFNVKDPAVVGAGQYNGQVSRLRSGGKTCRQHRWTSFG